MTIKGWKYNIHAKIITGYLTILICLILSLLIVINRMTALQNEVDFVSKHDIEVHDLANQIQKNILDMETGMRGYVITGDVEYLEPYNLGSRSWPDNYNKLHSMLSDNSSQQRNLEEIKPLILNWQANTGEYVINQKKANNETALNKHFEKNTGKKVTDQLRTQLDSFLSAEKKLTVERIEQLNQNNRNFKNNIVCDYCFGDGDYAGNGLLPIQFDRENDQTSDQDHSKYYQFRGRFDNKNQSEYS